MAKNIFSQKKRVTHIKNVSDNQFDDQGELQSESYDYVYNIMKGMDSLKAADYNPSDDPLKMELLCLTKEEYTQVQNPSSLLSSDCPQAMKTASKKLKNLIATRKFPLMEKSQKILKQLKHNRSIPKPRAHLASIDISLKNDLRNASKSLRNSKKELERKRVVTSKQKKTAITKDITQINTEVKAKISASKSKPGQAVTTDIGDKSKELCLVKNKTKNLTQVNTNLSARISKPVVSQKSKELCSLKSIDNDKNFKQREIPKRCEPPNKRIDAREVLKTGCNINDASSNKNPQCCDLSDGNTTDSEYERFIQNNKVEFEGEISKNTRKKFLKKKRVGQKKKSLNREKLQKSFPLENPDQHDSNSFDNLSDHDDEEKLERSFSRESLVEHYNTNSYSDLSDNVGEFKKEILKKQKQSKKKKRTKKKLLRKKKSQKSFQLESPANTHDSYHSSLSDGAKKEPERIERSISVESLIEDFNSNCCNNSTDEGEETDKNENILLNNSKSVNDNTSSNLETIINLQCSLNENKSIDHSFKDASSEKSSKLIENSNLDSNLNSSVNFEDSNCIGLFKPGTTISESSMNYTQNYSQGLQNTDSNLCNSSPSNCVSTTSNFDKLPIENLVIDLSSSDSEEENTKFPQPTVQKENSEEFKEDSAESDIEVIEVVPASNRSKSAAYSDSLSRMTTGVYSTSIKMYENEVKFSQTHAFQNIVQKDAMVLDSCKNMHLSLKACLNEKRIKKEPKIVESNNPVYMTGMCKDYNENEVNSYSLGSSNAISNECKLEKCETLQCENNSFVDDDIVIIEPPVNHSMKQEVQDNVINDFIFVKNEHVTHCVSSKRKNVNLESNMKNECPINYKIPKISTIIDKTSVEKELPIMSCTLAKSLIEQTFSSDSLSNSNVQHLLELYKKEFIMYQEIVRTEENIGAGLKKVEAHQAEKLKCIRGLIQNLVKNHPSFNKIFSDPVKTKEQDSVELNNFQNTPVDKFQSSKNSGEVSCRNSQDFSDSTGKLIPNFPYVHIKTEKEEKPGSCADRVSVDVSQLVASIKTEPCTSGTSDVSSSSSGVPEDKQALRLLGKKCDVCRKDAVAACQRCAKAFFCSNECGKKFWIDGHERVCDKYV